MSNQLERLLFFIVVISGALCTVEDYVIMSQCAHNKAIHLAAEGTVSVTDTSQIQNITIVGFPDYLNNEFKIALYAKETQRYLCFNDNWRLVGMRELRDTCYFNETIVHGYFVFRAVVDLQRRVGFTHRGKPVGPKKSVNDACYMFNKIEAEQFFRHHHNNNGNSGMGSGNSNNNNGSSNIRKPPRNNKNNRHKSNNQNQKLQQQQEHHGHNNNNVILNNSSTSLSSTNKKQLAINRQKQQQQQQQHQVRHHHNDPSLLLRRQQHEKKQKRRKQQKQQQHQQQQQQQRVSASPSKRMPATATATTTATIATTSTTAATATTLSSKRKGRRRKVKGKPKSQQQLLATAATSPYTDDSLYSSSSSSSTGFEDLDTYNSSSSSSSSSLEPWSTWSTIDSFSSSSTTATSDDSISSSSSSSSNYDAWATYITEMEAEASAMTPEMSGNDTELLQYEAEMVDDSEAESTATYETKATSAIAATAATTTSTAGSPLVIEQTPMARSNRRNSSIIGGSSSTRATPTATSQTEKMQNTQQPSRHRSNSRENPSVDTDNSEMLLAAENEVKPQQPRKLLWTPQPPAETRDSTRATSMTTPIQQLSSTAATSATTPQQHVAPSLFSVDKNINSNLNNTLTEASPTAAATTGVTAATTMKRPVRKFTQKLMATPYHQLTYVRNAGGDIDIDNLDNISVYPVVYNGDLEGIGGGNSSDGGFSGFLPTSTTSHLTEPIRIGMNRIRPNRTLHWFTHQRFA
ncbi:ras guanine nucleotide exchange factor glfB isoform X2 [Drosophila elegans]|uniref:ras guanine nucleotide exchange factor glfB isoform X2 n=1 Tax=Drosophila elegans TaxID=30023 RepID=UPI0007E7A40D|nr:ras guanine nucleotide exchange factor glfB isoform X2 [Drosophila elegans]